MKRLAFLPLLLWVFGGGPVRTEEEHPPEPVGTSLREDEDVTIHEAILPGELVDWAVAPDKTYPHSLLLLVELEDESRQVIRWSLEGQGALGEVGPSLPQEVTTLLSTGGLGDKDGTVLIAAGGTVLSLSVDGVWQTRFESPYDVFPVRDTTGGRPGKWAEIPLRSVGLLQAVAEDPDTGDLRFVWRYDLPLRVDREWGGLRLETPPVSLLDRTPEDVPRFILGPEAHGNRRIRSVLITPSTEGEPTIFEAWSMLPTAEEIEESWYLKFNGEPALIITSVMAEKHGVFEKKKLRLFQLTADRTRSGSGPLLEVMTRSRNWYGTCAGVADLNGDGLDDLVSAQPKGLGAGSLWVEGYLARSGGGFEAKARGSEIEVEEGEICTLAMDVDGDGHVELVVVEENSLLVFPLIRQANSKVVVEAVPEWRVAFHDIDGRPRPLEVLGPQSTQIFVIGHTEGKRQAVRVLRLH